MLKQAQDFQELVNVQRLIREICPCFDVFLDVQIRDEIVHLEHIPQMLAAVAREAFFVHILQLIAADEDLPCIRTVDPSENVQQRGFAGAGRSEQHAEFTLSDRKVQSAQDVLTCVATAEALFQAVYFQKCLILFTHCDDLP